MAGNISSFVDCQEEYERVIEAVAYALSCLQQKLIVLKDKQLEVLQELYQGNDVFAMGYGMSICYQLLLFLFDH